MEFQRGKRKCSIIFIKEILAENLSNMVRDKNSKSSGNLKQNKFKHIHIWTHQSQISEYKNKEKILKSTKEELKIT